MALGYSQKRFALQCGVADATLLKLEKFAAAIPAQDPRRVETLANVEFALNELEAQRAATGEAPSRLCPGAYSATREAREARAEWAKRKARRIARRPTWNEQQAAP